MKILNVIVVFVISLALGWYVVNAQKIKGAVEKSGADFKAHIVIEGKPSK